MNGWLAVALFWTIIGASVTLSRRWSPFHGTASREGGTPFRYSLTKNKHRVTGLCIALDVPDTVRFKLRRENPGDWIGKFLGIAREWQTADGLFDERIYIVSDDRVVHEALRADAGLRRAASALLANLDVKSIELDRGSLIATARLKGGARDEDEEGSIVAEEAARLLPQLAEFRDRLLARGAEPWCHARDPGWTHSFVAAALLGGMGAAGIIVELLAHNSSQLPIPLQHDHVFSRAALHAGILAAAALAVLLLATGRRSRSHVLVAYLLLVAAPGAWLVAEAHFEGVNLGTVLDAETFEAYVEAKHVRTHRRSSDTYHLEFSELPYMRGKPELQVDHDTFNRIVEDTCARLDIRVGALRDAFLAGIQSQTCGSQGP